jgi:hypothetical protein
MFCTPVLIFGCTECVGSCFHVLRARTHFLWYRGHRVPLSCFARSNSIWTVPRSSLPIFIFYASGLVFGLTEGVVFRFHVLRSRTRFRRYRRRRVPFSCFALLDSFSAVPRSSGPRSSGPVFKFYAPGLFFGGTEGVRSRFMCLRTWIRFRRYQGRRVPFQVLCSRTHFRWYQGRLVPISCLARSDTFSVVLRASGPDFMICAPGVFFDSTEGVPSRFHVLRSRTRFRWYRGSRVPFSHFTLTNSF